MTEKEQIVFENLYARRSVRSFVEGKPVEREKIVKLLEAAMAAPSACNIQPWEFIVVTDPDMIQALKEKADIDEYNAQLLIVVCGYPKFIPWENDIGTVDCAAAIENILLAATAMDLGSVWLGYFIKDALKELLGIPEDSHPIGLVYLGYPADHPEPRTQYDEDAVYWEKYDASREHVKRKNCVV